MSTKKNKRKRRRRRDAGSYQDASTGASASTDSAIHFTIGTGPHTDPATGQLSLEHDIRLLKSGVLYADRIKLCSIGSSLTARMLRVTEADLEGQLDFLERHFSQNIARGDPEAAATVVEFIRRYRELRDTRNSTREQLKLRGQLLAEIRPIWEQFREEWTEFARAAGVEQVLAAQRTGLVELHEFSAGGVERSGALDPSTSSRRSSELFEALTQEFLKLMGNSVARGTSMPLVDEEAGELLRLSIEAGEVESNRSGSYRGRHAGLASSLLRGLPLFDEATVGEVMDIRDELGSPLVRFRGAVARLSETLRAEGWSPELAAAVEEVRVREMDPAVQEIEERIRENRYLARLSNGYRAAATTAPAVAVATYQLSSLPELASAAVGGASGLVAGAGLMYEQWRSEYRDIRSNEMFFYRETRRLLNEQEP